MLQHLSQRELSDNVRGVGVGGGGKFRNLRQLFPQSRLIVITIFIFTLKKFSNKHDLYALVVIHRNTTKINQ